jgi:hypothetical protein
VSVRDLVVSPGDRVSVAGRRVSRADGDWLDLARVDNLVIKPVDWISDRSIKVIGLDPAKVPEDFGPNNDIIQGWARVTGPWRDDKITVEIQTPVPRPTLSHRSHLACDPPPGGWDTGSNTTRFPELEDLRASGVIVVDSWLREEGGALVLRVATQDIALVNHVLGPLLPRRLCVTASRYTAEDIQGIEAAFTAHYREWLLEIWRPKNLTANGQPYAEAELIRVTQSIAEWADSLPEGLLRLRPIMTPA